MLRVIREFSPLWVIAENVRGLLTQGGGVVFEQVCLDLESSGYEVQPLIIPAVAVNAPHRRDRVWFVAHRTGERCNHRGDNRKERPISDDKRIAEESEPERKGWECRFGEINVAQNSISERSGGRLEDNGQILGREPAEIENARPDWTANWLEVATEFCGVDDEFSDWLVRLPDGTKMSRAAHRRESLKALGNAIVPAVAVEIMKAIKKVDEEYVQK